MEVKKVTKKLRITTPSVIKYQLLTEIMFFKEEHLIPSDLEILVLLVMWGPMELVGFCMNAAKELYPETAPEDLSVRSQNVRNRIVKLEKRNIVIKSKTGRKVISLNPDINIQSEGNILLDYNYLAIESNKA
jgi:hypothetical protein